MFTTPDIRAVSCILYNGEKRLLNLRLREEREHVSCWVLCEGTHTFTRRERFDQPFWSGDLEPCNSDLRPRIIRLTVPMLHSSPWANEADQRNAPCDRWFVNGLDDYTTLIVHDADEIHRREDLPDIIAASRTNGMVKILQHNHYYKLNYYSDRDGQWGGSFAATVGWLRNSRRTLDQLRKDSPGAPEIKTNGHHYSYCMSPEKIAEKLASFSHSELCRAPYIKLQHIQRCVDNGFDLFGRMPGRVWRSESLTDPRTPTGVLENMAAWLDLMGPAEPRQAA